MLNVMENKGINITDYLNAWICAALFFRQCEKRNFNKVDKINHLIKYLKT